MKIIDEGFVIEAAWAPAERQSHFFPSICRLRSGTILVPCRRGSTKMSPDGNCIISASTDSGKTWETICDGFESRVDGIEGEIRCAELFEHDDTRLIATLTWLDRSNTTPDTIRNAETDELAPSKVLHAESIDGGRTWSHYKQLDTGPYQSVVQAGAPLRISDKGWLITAEETMPSVPGKPGRQTAIGLLTRDGKTVDQVVEVARDPQCAYNYWDQRQAICPKTGRQVALFWTYDRANEKDAPIHLAWGDPEKLTWSRPSSTGLEGQVATPIPLRDGRLLAFHVHRHPPASLRLVVSTDRGATWDRDEALTIYELHKQEAAMEGASYDEFWTAMGVWTFGHPAGLEIDRNTVLLIYYAGRDETQLSVRWSRVQVAPST